MFDDVDFREATSDAGEDDKEEGQGDEEEGQGDTSKGTPGRAALRRDAAAALARQGDKMKKQALSGNGRKELAVGNVVQINVEDMDRARTDDPTLTCVIGEVITKGGGKIYRVGTKAGVLKDTYHASYLTPLPNMTPTAMGLAGVVEGWAGLPQGITLRGLLRSQSLVGGQGMVSCSCKGKCDTKACSCKKAKRECTSRCHKGSDTCTNMYKK